MRFPLSFILFFLALTPCYAQLFPYRHYSTNDGLPHSNVFCMEQDARGFLWLGTENGLCRFDGHEFINYSQNNHLNAYEITAMCKSVDGKRIYIGIYDQGIDYLENGNLFPYRLDTGERLVFPNLVESSGVLYSGLFKELKEIRAQKTTTYQLFEQFGSLHCVAAASRGGLLLGTDSGMYLLKKKRLQPLLRLGPVKTIIHDRQGNIWIGGAGYIYQLNKSGTDTLRSISIGKQYAADHMLIDAGDRLWYWAASASKPHKVCMFDGIKTYPIGAYLGIDELQINYFYEDAQQNIWICTFGKGIYCLYNFFISNYTMREGLSNNYIFSINKQPDGDLLIGSYKGLSVIDKEGLIRRKKSAALPGGIYREIHTQNQELYVAGISPSFKNIIQQPLGTKKMIYCWARSLLIKGDTILLGRWNNEIEFFIRSSASEFRPYKKVKLFSNQSGYVRINRIMADSMGRIWVATNRGLCLLGKTSVSIPLSPSDQYAYINTVLADPKGYVWAGGKRGLMRLEGHTWSPFVIAGQDFSLTTSLCYDRNGRLWIGTLNGLYCSHGKSISAFSKYEGLLSDNINALFYDSACNYLWVGSSEGLSRIDLSKLKSNPSDYFPVSISSISYAGQTFHPDTIHEIPYAERNLLIQFTQPEFRTPNHHTYTYWFADKPDHLYETRQSSIQFSSIAPGNYTLFIKGLGSSLARIDFTVKEPFWMSWAFILCSICCSGALLTWFIQHRIHSVKKREQQKRKQAEELQRLRHQAVAAMMNPHFIFNALNTVQHFVNRNKQEEANEFLAGFGRLIRANLDVNNRSSIPLSEELARLEQYLALEKMRFGEKLQYLVETDRNIPSATIAVPNMILQPFAENALKHGILPASQNGLLRIHVALESREQIRITIEDNGIGLKAAQQQGTSHPSMGIRVVEERLKLLLHEQYVPVEIQDRSDGRGTRVILRLPVQPLTQS